jgi:hypothetical protein
VVLVVSLPYIFSLFLGQLCMTDAHLSCLSCHTSWSISVSYHTCSSIMSIISYMHIYHAIHLHLSSPSCHTPSSIICTIRSSCHTCSSIMSIMSYMHISHAYIFIYHVHHVIHPHLSSVSCHTSSPLMFVMCHLWKMRVM